MKDETEERMTDEDVQFWLKNPAVEERRVVIPAALIRDLVTKHLFEESGTDLNKTDNMFIWNPDGVEGLPELVIIRMPDPH